MQSGQNARMVTTGEDRDKIWHRYDRSPNVAMAYSGAARREQTGQLGWSDVDG